MTAAACRSTYNQLKCAFLVRTHLHFDRNWRIFGREEEDLERKREREKNLGIGALGMSGSTGHQ
jgi:hypothetical protein